MKPPELNLTLETESTEEPLTFIVERLVCAGWVGRDPSAVKAHVEELAQLGIPGPSQTPTYMNYAPYLATTERGTLVPKRFKHIFRSGVKP